MAGGQALEGDSVSRKTIFEIRYGSKEVEIRRAIDPGTPEFQRRSIRAPSEENIESILNVGILQPAQGYRDGLTEESKPGSKDQKQIVVLIFGNGRWIDWNEAARRFVEAGGDAAKFWPFRVEIVKPPSKFAVLERKQIENHARMSVNPIDDAREALKMLEVGGADPANGPTPETASTWERVRIAFGKQDVPGLQKLLRVLDLHEKIQGEIAAGNVSLTAALALVKAQLPRDKQLAEFEKMKAAGGEITVTRALKTARAAKNGTVVATWNVPGSRQLGKFAKVFATVLETRMERAKSEITIARLKGAQYTLNFMQTGEDPDKLFTE